MSKNINYQNLSIKKEIEDPCETIVQPPIPLPTTIFSNEFNINEKEFNSGVNSSLMMGVNNPTHYSQTESPQQAFTSTTRSKPALKKRKTTRKRYVYSKPKKKNKKKKEAEKVLNTLNILNLQYLSEKRSNDNHSDCSSDTIILDDVNEEISGQYSSNELPNILCKTEELEPELGKLLISADMLTDATHEASTVSSKISNSKGRNKSSKMKNNPTEYEALQCKDSDVPLLFSIKREHEEISEPPILYPVTKEVVHTFSDNEKVEMAAFPSASEPLNEAVQPVTKKQKTKTTKRNNKKQAASKSKPNKILNENLTSDDFFSMKDKDFFSDQSFSKSNLLQNAVEKSKRKKPATKRKAPKKTVQTSAPLNNESVFEQWNNVNCLTNTSFTVNVAEKPKRKKSAPNRKTKKDSIEPKISFELEETSECNGLLSVKRAKKSAPRKKATRASTKKKEKKSTIIDSKKESDAAICVKKEVIDPSHSENSLKLAKSNAAECKVNASKVISSEIVNTDSLAIVSMSFEEENIKKESNDTLTFLLSVPDKSTETISDIDSSKSVMKKYVKKKSKASFCKSDTNLDNISSIPIDYIVSGSKLRSKTVTKPLPEPWQDSVASDSKLRSRIVTRSSRNLNALKIRKENESAPNRIVSIKTNISNNLPPRIMDKDKSSNDSDVMRPANHSSDTSVQEYSAISNVHFQNSFVDSRKNMHYPRIVIKKEPQDLTESTKTSLDSILSPIHFSNDSDKEKKSCDDLIISDPTPNLCNTSIPCNLNCNKLTQNPKIMARTHDEEIPQVKHSMKTYANTEESHNSILSINTPNAVSDCQSFDNSVPSSQSKICESYNVFLSRIKKEPKEAEKNVTVVENSCTKKSNCVESEKYVFNKDSLTTSITNEISEENTHKKALLLQSNYNVSNLKTASANLDMNTLSINESLQSDKCNQEMPRLEPFIANVDKNYSVPFTSIDNVVSNIHASDNSAHTQLKTCKTAFDSFLNVTIKNEPEEAVEKYSYAGNSNSVVSIHSLDQQEYEKTASKRNSTNCLTGKIDNCKHNEILEESSSSFTSCNISNLKLKSSTLDTHELVRNKSSQSNSAALQMPQFAVSSRKAVANTNESCSVTVANATATPVCSRTPDNFEQIQLKTSKSSSDTFLKVQIKEEPKDFTDEIIANVRDERSSIEVQLCNELREENFCISQESSVLNSIDSYVNKSVQKVTEDKVDVPFSIRKSLEIPNVNSVLPALSIKQDICSDSENMTTTSVYQSAIIGEMDRNPSLVNVSYSAKSVSQSLTNQKTLQTVENNNYIASSVVTSHHENVVLDKFSKNPSSVNIDCSPGLIGQSSDHGNKLQTVENSNISIMTSHNKSTVYGRTDQNLYPVDKVFSSDNMDQVLIPERMPQTIEKSSLITSSAIVAHQESTINTSKDMNILPVDLDCSSDLSNKNFTNEKNSLFSSTTFDVEAAMFCENTHQSSIDFSEEHSDQCTDFPTSSNEKNNALSALSKETETELKYNHNSLKSDSSSCLSPKSGSNLSDNLMLNFRESSSNYTCVSHDKVIIESVENLVDFSEIPDKNSTPEKHLNDKHVDVHHSFIDEDQNSLDSKLLDMSDVSDSSGSDDELSDEEVEEFLDRVSNFISCFDDLLKLSDEDENEESVKYIEKCFDYISQAVIDTIGSNEESDSEHSLVTERITSELVTLSDIDSCSINDSTSFDMNEITVEGEDEENTCTQNETFERINSRPVRPSNIDSVSVVMNEITSEKPVTSSNIDPCNVIEPVSVANNSGEESTCSQTARLERITSSPVTLSDTGPCNVIDSVSIDINKIISEEDLEKNAPSGIAAVEKIISTPITPISTDFCNVIEPVSVVINKMNSEELNTCNEAITFERIISRPVTSTHADPCNVLDSEKNICSQTTAFETTTISSVLNEISSPEEIEENICNQITISEGISGPVSAKDSYLCNVTNSVLPELEIMDDSMDSVQTEASSVSSFNLNQNDGKFDILFNFQKNLKKFFKHPYPGESCFKLTQQTKSELKYSRLHNIYQHICVKEMAEKLKIAAEAEGNSKYKVGDTVTFESYPLTKEEIECYYKLVVMSPSISLMSKCNSAVAVGPYTKSEINSANACDVTYRPISLNLVSSPLNLVSNPLNLLSNQAFQHDQLLKESSFENDNKESNEIPDHSSLLPGHSSLLPDHSSLLPDHSSLLQNIENDTQRTVSNDVSFDATSNLRLLLESLKGRILHLNEGKSIKDPTSQDHCKTFDECTLISRTEIHKNSHLNILTTNDTINIVKENEIILDLVEVSENSSSSNIPTVNNKMLNINDQNISSQLQNALIDISNSSKDKQTDTIQNVGTVNKSYLKSQNTEIEPSVFENSIDPYFGNQLVSNLSLKSIHLKQQLPFSDSVVEQEENVQVEECSSQLPNLLCNQYENILMPQNLENTSEPKSSHFIQLPVLNSHNEESCFEKAKDVQVCTMDHNISAQSSKSEGSCSSVKETAIFPNPILNKVDVPVTDLLKILQTANNLPISDHEGLPFASLNFKETRDYDHSVLSQNSFQDNISYDQDCLHNAKYLNRSNYGGDYQPLLKIPVVRDYGHKSAEDLDFDHSPVTFKEKDQISVQTIDKLSNDVCSPKSINIPNNNLNNECVDSNSELHIRSTCDGQDLKIFSNNLEEIESSNKKENEQHVPQYKSRWEKIMERKSLETSSQTKFSNHLLKDCFPVKLSKNKLKLKKPIAHVQPCSQSLTKDSLKLKEFPSLSNLPLHTKSIKANSPLHTKSVKADPPLHTKTAKADPPLHTKS
ncbi:AAA_11 domain-containing protein, partial [Nephila pilipes]